MGVKRTRRPKHPECPLYPGAAYFLRRVWMRSNAPDSNASAVEPEPASISGTGLAIAVPAIPIKSRIIPIDLLKLTSDVKFCEIAFYVLKDYLLPSATANQK